MLLALLIHETGHLIISRMTGERIELLELTPFGGVMTYAHGTVCHKGIKGVCVHAAGPLINYAAMMLSCAPILKSAVDQAFLRAFVIANASMFLLNLLPVLPLDGGQIVFSIGYYFFPVARLVSVLSVLGILAGLGFIALSIYGLLFRGILNCSLLMIGGYIAFQATCSHHALLAQNVYTIVQERLAAQTGIRSILFYQVSPDTKLISLVPLMKDGTACRFIFGHENAEYAISEDVFCQLLLQMPSAGVEEAYFAQLCKEKHDQRCFTP